MDFLCKICPKLTERWNDKPPLDHKNLIYNSILLFLVATLYLKFEVFYLILRRFLSFIVFLKENIGKLSVQAHPSLLLFLPRTGRARAELHKLNFTFLPEEEKPPRGSLI